MKRRLRALIAVAVAFVVLSAGDCEIGDLGLTLDKPGRIVVSNTGTEPAVLAIVADDVKSYPTLASGSTTSVETNVSGQYRVIVAMSPESAVEYRAELMALRSTVEKLLAGSLDSAEKTRLFISLAGIKNAIARLEDPNGASCSGLIELKHQDPETVNATVAFVTQSGSGFWDLACGST